MAGKIEDDQKRGAAGFPPVGQQIAARHHGNIAAGHKLRFMPALDGDGVVALGYRSSKLNKEEFSDLIETIYSQGLQRGVVFPA